MDGKEVEETGFVGPFKFLSTITDSEVILFKKNVFTDGADKVTVWKHTPTKGERIMRPGLKFKLDEGSTGWRQAEGYSLDETSLRRQS